MPLDLPRTSPPSPAVHMRPSPLPPWSAGPGRGATGRRQVPQRSADGRRAAVHVGLGARRPAGGAGLPDPRWGDGPHTALAGEGGRGGGWGLFPVPCSLSCRLDANDPWEQRAFACMHRKPPWSGARCISERARHAAVQAPCMLVLRWKKGGDVRAVKWRHACGVVMGGGPAARQGQGGCAGRALDPGPGHRTAVRAWRLAAPLALRGVGWGAGGRREKRLLGAAGAATRELLVPKATGSGTDVGVFLPCTGRRARQAPDRERRCGQAPHGGGDVGRGALHMVCVAPAHACHVIDGSVVRPSTYRSPSPLCVHGAAGRCMQHGQAVGGAPNACMRACTGVQLPCISACTSP